MDTDPKTCLITGASGGVATALAQRLQAQGTRVCLITRAPERLRAQEGAVVVAADVATEAGAADALAQATAAFGAPPAAVVNCAGAVLVAPLARTSEAQYRACMSANLDTAFFVAKAYAAALQQAARAPAPDSPTPGQGGALVLFSSVAAGIGIGNHAAIAAAKGAIEALTRALAADFSGIGMRTNAIAPGLLDTGATSKFVASELGRKAMAAQYPLGRYGQAEDAAALAAFLISAQATWINGQIIGLDGGFCAVRPAIKVS
jgi:NAD(P)-dependent dehydrogenase (short-subunit alcohol dehydrogenase family)